MTQQLWPHLGTGWMVDCKFVWVRCQECFSITCSSIEIMNYQLMYRIWNYLIKFKNKILLICILISVDKFLYVSICYIIIYFIIFKVKF